MTPGFPGVLLEGPNLLLDIVYPKNISDKGDLVYPSGQDTPSSAPSSSSRQSRMTQLNTEQKESILAMSKPSDLNPDERKRQYSSLRRAIYRDAPAPLVAKFQMCSDLERLFDLKQCTLLWWSGSTGLLTFLLMCFHIS